MLLVEDDASIREVATLGLERAGFRVTATGDGRDGLLRFRQGPFDLVAGPSGFQSIFLVRGRGDGSFGLGLSILCFLELLVRFLESLLGADQPGIQVIEPGEGGRHPVPLEPLRERPRLAAGRQQRRIGEQPAEAQGQRRAGIPPGQPVPDIEVQVIDRRPHVIPGTAGLVQDDLDVLRRRQLRAQRLPETGQIGTRLSGQRARPLVRGHLPDPGQVRRQRPGTGIAQRPRELPAVIQLSQQPAEVHRQAYRVLSRAPVGHGIAP